MTLPTILAERGRWMRWAASFDLERFNARATSSPSGFCGYKQRVDACHWSEEEAPEAHAARYRRAPNAGP